MATITFDTLKLARKLEAAGFSREQATGMDIAELRTEFHRELGAMIWKVAALLLAQGASIVALLKLLP